MEKRTVVMITFLVLILLVGGLYIFTDWFSKVTGYFTGEAEREKVAQCLAQKGAEYYGSDFCPDCEKQKKEFGNSFKLVSYVDCGENKVNCPNVREIPAWYMDKQIYYGYKTLDELKQLSNCN